MSLSHSIVFIYQPKGNPMSLINTQVQPFKAQAFHNGKFIEVSNEALKGKWSVLIFMPAAFTFNCPTEVEDAADNYAEFQKAGAEVYIVTTHAFLTQSVARNLSCRWQSEVPTRW
jgi:peroxiredoxin (alkyl hydroperoxide reductase subunit C)